MVWAFLIELLLTAWTAIRQDRRDRERARRNRKIRRAYGMKGHTVAQLADAYGLSHAEVQDILDGGHGPDVPSLKTSGRPK